MNINQWPESERPREKLLAKGAKSLSDAELLAIFIRTGTKDQTAVDIARELLNKLGNIRNLLQAKFDQFCKFQGLGMTKFVTLQAALELSRRYLYESVKHSNRNVLTNSRAVRTYLKAHFGNLEHEIFACVFLDNQHQVIVCEELTQGGISQTGIYPRELIKKIIQYNASGIILVHNHTSNAAFPSASDMDTTQKLRQILSALDIALVDHIIIGKQKIFSFIDAKLW